MDFNRPIFIKINRYFMKITNQQLQEKLKEINRRTAQIESGECNDLILTDHHNGKYSLQAANGSPTLSNKNIPAKLMMIVLITIDEALCFAGLGE